MGVVPVADANTPRSLLVGTRSGSVTLIFPGDVNTGDLDDLDEYLAIFRRVLEKKAATALTNSDPKDGGTER